jgi:hypothetical protein
MRSFMPKVYRSGACNVSGTSGLWTLAFQGPRLRTRGRSGFGAWGRSGAGDTAVRLLRGSRSQRKLPRCLRSAAVSPLVGTELLCDAAGSPSANGSCGTAELHARHREREIERGDSPPPARREGGEPQASRVGAGVGAGASVHPARRVASPHVAARIALRRRAARRLARPAAAGARERQARAGRPRAAQRAGPHGGVGITERDPARDLVWFHAPSVGEGLQARAVVEAFRRRRPRRARGLHLFLALGGAVRHDRARRLRRLPAVRPARRRAPRAGYAAPRTCSPSPRRTCGPCSRARRAARRPPGDAQRHPAGVVQPPFRRGEGAARAGVRAPGPRRRHLRGGRGALRRAGRARAAPQRDGRRALRPGVAARGGRGPRRSRSSAPSPPRTGRCWSPAPPGRRTRSAWSPPCAAIDAGLPCGWCWCRTSPPPRTSPRRKRCWTRPGCRHARLSAVEAGAAAAGRGAGGPRRRAGRPVRRGGPRLRGRRVGDGGAALRAGAGGVRAADPLRAAARQRARGRRAGGGGRRLVRGGRRGSWRGGWGICCRTGAPAARRGSGRGRTWRRAGRGGARGARGGGAARRSGGRVVFAFAVPPYPPNLLRRETAGRFRLVPAAGAETAGQFPLAPRPA